MPDEKDLSFRENSTVPNATESLLDNTRKSLVEKAIAGEKTPLGSNEERTLKRFEEVVSLRRIVWERKTGESNCQMEAEEIESIALSASLHDINLEELTMESLFFDSEKLTRRLQMKLLDIYGRSPDLARLMVEKSIVGGHGTRSGSLVEILIHGLKPTEFQKKQILSSFTGTYDFAGKNFNQIATSFASWSNDRDLVRYTQPSAVNIHNLSGWMESYNREIGQPDLSPQRKLMLDWVKHLSDFLNKPDKNDKEQDIDTCLRADFPVIFLIGKPILNEKETNLVDSDIQYEFSVKGGVDSAEIPIILVPKDKIELTKSMAEKYGWHGEIVGIEAYSTERR